MVVVLVALIVAFVVCGGILGFFFLTGRLSIGKLVLIGGGCILLLIVFFFVFGDHFRAGCNNATSNENYYSVWESDENGHWRTNYQTEEVEYEDGLRFCQSNLYSSAADSQVGGDEETETASNNGVGGILTSLLPLIIIVGVLGTGLALDFFKGTLTMGKVIKVGVIALVLIGALLLFKFVFVGGAFSCGEAYIIPFRA